MSLISVIKIVHSHSFLVILKRIPKTLLSKAKEKFLTETEKVRITNKNHLKTFVIVVPPNDDIFADFLCF